VEEYHLSNVSLLISLEPRITYFTEEPKTGV